MTRQIDEKLLIEIRDDIRNADKILIGIGKEWELDVEGNDDYYSGVIKNVSKETIIGCEDLKINPDEKKTWVKLYKKVKGILEDKDYYVISLLSDDVIYDVFNEADNVVAPCGGYRLLQCGQHIMTRDEVAIKDGTPVCPVCGCQLSYNNIMNEEYMEESYLSKFGEYKGWLQSTINKKLVILELGTDMRFPQVIRFAFDRLVKFNLKSKLYRVNRELYMVDSSAEGRGIAVCGDSLELVNKL